MGPFIFCVMSISKAEFARALGVGGNDNIVKKIAFEWEKGTKRMKEQTVKKMRAIVTEGQITKVSATTLLHILQ